MNRPIANKALGQHYLVSTSVIETICSDFIEAASEIIEVGPGPAVLTNILAKKKLPLIVVEKDVRFLPHLEDIIPSENILIKDALKLNFNELISERNFSDNVWLVSNLPYNAAAPLLISFVKVPSIKYMTLMFQKEVGEKTVSTNSNKEMNSLLAICSNYFDTKVLCKVPPGAFAPPPKVDSIVISFVRKGRPLIPLESFSSFEKFLRIVFGHRRKQLGTVLKKTYADIDIITILEELGISPKIRAENLTQDELVNLFKKSRKQ